MVSSHADWRNWRIFATLFTVFLAGGFIGAYAMREIHRYEHSQLAFQPGNTGRLSYDQLKSQLNLTPDQAAKLRLILDDMVKYNQDLQSQIEDFRATGKNRIRSILNPEQQQHFEKLCQQVQAR